MLGLAETLQLVLTALVIVIFVIMASFTLFMMVRTMKAQERYYPPWPDVRQLVKELMCPKCGSKDLEAIGHHTIRCKGCGFTFSVGALPYPIYHGWWFWPIFWWLIIWFWPITSWARSNASRS